MFSNRVQTDLTPNRLARAIERVRAAGGRPIDLTESNPTRAGFDYPAGLLQPLADPRALTYAPQPLGLPAAREAVARDYARRGLAVSSDRIVLTASTSDAYTTIFKLLCDPGDEVLVPRPSYPLFEHLSRLDGVAARPYDLEYHGRWTVDEASVERACSARTRAILIVSPNNPTGSLVSASELQQLAALAAAHDAALVVDEVFADYELTTDARAGAGDAVTVADTLSFSLGGLSKSVGLPQVKLGWMAVSGPGPLVDEALRRLEVACDSYLPVSTPVQEAAGDLLTAGAAIRQQIQTRVRGNYQWLAASAAQADACRALAADAGWYAVVQVPSLSSEEELVLDLLDREQVLVHPGYFFDFPRESYLIVSLLPRPSAFREGLSRILARFDARVSRS